MDKRTVAGCALGALLICGPKHICAQDQPTPSSETRVAEERGRRALDVTSTIGAVGISSGMVIAYGHPLQQPYQFEYRDGLLFINGIQVEPSLVLQREQDKNRPALSSDEHEGFRQLEALGKRVRQRYFEQKGKVPDAELKAEILATVRADPHVKDAEWTGDTVLSYHPKGRFESVLNGISFTPTRSPNPKKKDPEELKQGHTADLERHLKEGGCIFWGTTGPWFKPGWQCRDIKKKVREVMENPGLTDSEREKKLQTLFGSADPALDALTNYKRDEWK